MTNTENRELTAAELDLVVGAAIFMKIDGVKATSVACDGIGAALLDYNGQPVPTYK